MDSEKLINSFEIDNRISPLVIYGNIFFLLIVNNFLTLLLWEIYVFDIFNIVDF